MEYLANYKELKVWQKSMDLVEIVYKFTTAFPKEEMYGLTSQLRRASLSVPVNIAEGHARNTTGEFLQFLGIAKGSLAELETLLELSQRLNYLKKENSEILLMNSTEIS